MNCEECELYAAEKVCLDCSESFCISCAEAIHQKGARRSHLLESICNFCPSSAIYFSSNGRLCQNCFSYFGSPPVNLLPQERILLLYWDMLTCRPSSQTEFDCTLQEISASICMPTFIKTYGDPSGVVTKSFSSTAEVFKENPEVLLLDMAASCSERVTDLLVVSREASKIRNQVYEIRYIYRYLTVHLCSNILPLESLRPPSFYGTGSGFNEEEGDKKWKIIRFLKELASKGEIMNELEEFREKIKKIVGEEGDFLIEECEKNELVVIKARELPDKPPLQFISLKLTELNLACLHWALRSLKLDEMLPTEQSVIQRLKEAFDLKFKNEDWKELLQKTQQTPDDFSLFSNTNSNSDENLFEIREISEPTGGSTLVIYPKGEEWVALDEHSKYGDYLRIKEKTIWKEFLNFLAEFYESPREHPKSISGGRYGCAWYIKTYGTPALKELSIGKLSYMIQLAFLEDLLRYQRTQVVWSKDFSEDSQNNSPSKLQIVKETLIKLLKDTPEGISLAQIPEELKNELPFPLILTELGFAKLKDLLVTLPEITVETRESRHPFAVLKKKEMLDLINSDYLKEIVEILGEITSNFRNGISEAELEDELELNLKKKVDWSEFFVENLLEFILTYCRNLIDICENTVFSAAPKKSTSLLPDPVLIEFEKSRLPNEVTLPKKIDLYSENPDKFVRRSESLQVAENIEMIRRDKQHKTMIENLGLTPPPGFDYK